MSCGEIGMRGAILRILLIAAALAPVVDAHAAKFRARAEDWKPARISPLPQDAVLPSPESLEAQGTTIGRILVQVEEIFDTSHAGEDSGLYRAANALHMETRPATVLAALSFREGEPFRAAALAESERMLRSKRYLYDAVVRVAAWDEANKRVDIEVSVKDVWTLTPGLSYSSNGGASKSRIEIEELNLFGRGKKLQFLLQDDVDRTTTALAWKDANVFGSRWQTDLKLQDLSDGSRQFFDIGRPFYSLDSRWATGLTLDHDKHIETRYDLSRPVDALQVDRRQAELRYGWSPGLSDGWTRRWWTGLRFDQKEFAEAPLISRAELPADQKFSYPWIGIEWEQDGYAEVRNQDQIGRIEDVNLGTTFSASLGYSSTGFGSTADAWHFRGEATHRRTLSEDRELKLMMSTRGRVESGDLRDAMLQAEVRHDWRLGEWQRLLVRAVGTFAEGLDPDRQLLLGAEEGLRGYPFRYQGGTSSALLTIEHRLYTHWYPFHLFNVGGAAFFDAGRTWGPTGLGLSNQGLLKDVGLGLRIGNSRSGAGSVIHVDLSYALDTVPFNDRFQVTITTKRNF